MSLERFREAQNSPVAGFDAALDELRAGAKRGHWIWYVFPQIEGLGRSPQSRRFALRGADEAAAFLRDAELRARLLTITRTVTGALRARRAASLRTLMGSDIDARKVVSSLTLFRHVARTLHEREGLDEYRALAEAADVVLARAAEEGYAPCAHTLERLVK
jgi:uncharacterized protein (DUF1810 family)